MMGPAPVWFEDSDAPYRSGVVVSDGGSAAQVMVQPDAGGKPVQRRPDQVFPRADGPAGGVPDNAQLPYLHEASLLHNLTQRYENDHIYTYVGSILVAVNPYKQIPHLYDHASMDGYRGRALGVMPPHVFAIADRARRMLMSERHNQSIVVSGEARRD